MSLALIPKIAILGIASAVTGLGVAVSLDGPFGLIAGFMAMCTAFVVGMNFLTFLLRRSDDSKREKRDEAKAAAKLIADEIQAAKLESEIKSAASKVAAHTEEAATRAQKNTNLLVEAKETSKTAISTTEDLIREFTGLKRDVAIMRKQGDTVIRFVGLKMDDDGDVIGDPPEPPIPYRPTSENYPPKDRTDYERESE